MDREIRQSVTGQADVEQARREARQFAQATGFGLEDAEAVALAVSELATNLLRYAVGGQISVDTLDGVGLVGLRIESRDVGPGIADSSLALQDGYSTGSGLGSGLPAVRRLMDEFQIDSSPGGTLIVATKWLRT